jgi:hypothetical protein
MIHGIISNNNILIIMSVNWATSSLGASLVDCSSETNSNEAVNILDPRPAKLWLSSEGLPQWLSISLLGLKDIDKRSICIRTIGWRCWHAYHTNPRKVTLHVSADGAKFRVWDKFIVPRPASGTHLFCCAPISIAIYPYIALEVTHTFGGLQTYINRIYFYTDEIPASPLAGVTKLDSTSNSTVDGQSDADGQSDIEVDATSNSNSISIIKSIQESSTKEIQVVTQTNDDASFSLIDNLTSALEISTNDNDDDKYIGKVSLTTDAMNENQSTIPITPANNMNFVDTPITSSSSTTNTNEGPTAPTNIRRLSTTSSPTRSSVTTLNSSQKKTTDQSTSPRRINSTDNDHHQHHYGENNNSNHHQQQHHYDNQHQRNQHHNEHHHIHNINKNHNNKHNNNNNNDNINHNDDNDDSDDIKSNRIQYLEEKISKLEALISNSVEIGNTIKIAKEKTGRIRRHLHSQKLRKGFSDDFSDSTYDSDDDSIDLGNSNDGKLPNNFNDIPTEKVPTIDNRVVDILEGVDSKLSSLYAQAIQSEKNIELAPSLSNTNINETFDINKLRRQYLSSNEIETLLNKTWNFTQR